MADEHDRHSLQAPDESQTDIPSENMPVQPRFLSGTPVYGRDSTRLGELTRSGEQDGHLVMRRITGDPEIALPLSVVLHDDTAGVYTTLAWRDLDALMPPPPPGSQMGLLDAFAAGAEAAHANHFSDDEPS